jgi:radical SAM superfamily enzyme YgiQ (UPF0313 family)
VINKDIATADLLAGAREAWRQGWRGLKLYFMLGLPTERDEDVTAIARLAMQVSGMRREFGGGPGTVNLALSTFVPRPWTPFQWEAMDPPGEIRRKQQLLLGTLRMRSVKVRFQHPERSLLEGVLCRGDRRLAAVIEEAHRRGARLDGWDEHFDWGLWLQAFETCGLDPVEQGLGARDPGAALPWDHLQCGVDKAWLAAERDRSREGRTTPACTEKGCHRCGHDPERCRRLWGR